MHDHLGFRRYAAHGGDLGAGITSRLAEPHPESVVGIHLLAVAASADHDPASLTPEEQKYPSSAAAWPAEEGGYMHQQSTRPLTLAPRPDYWFTGTISTPFRPYYEYAHHLTRRVQRVDVPTALTLFPADLSQPP